MATTASSRTFTSLPRARYLDPEWFAREMDDVIARQWIYFGHESQLPKPGDVLVRDICDESVVATRDDDGKIHAFFNVCRHRGYRLCDPGADSAKQLVCPYHRWSYELDGRLLGAPSMRDGVDFDFADYGLHRVGLETWRGLIFVCLGDAAPRRSVAEGFAGTSAELDPYRPETLKVATEREYDIAANWKLVLENFLECYHCQGSHPEFCKVADIRDLHDTLLDGTFMADEFWSAEFRIQGDSFTLDGERACSIPLGTAAPGSNVAFGLQPTLTAFHLYIDHTVVHEMLPVSPDRCRMTTQWLVHVDAVEGRDYDPDELARLWDVTNRQDVALCERNQLGVRSRSFTPGPNSPVREPAIRAALAEYHKLLGEADQFEALTGEPL